ncbi:unnamed protein product [Thelazia callipaeda]|uniref:MyTH4 domain-containing protein n=1 Tax=Thelazia callipaeda TaxID=103827 RepID=A0A0N5DBR8_THECL|nr:unnamed protein product [Thelazia callipaeda]
MMDREYVYEQMRHIGLLETVRIRRSGYPIQYDYDLFVERFRLLADGIGQQYENMLTLKVTLIQKTVRGWINRIQFEKMKTAAVTVQRYWRGYIQRQRYRKVLLFNLTSKLFNFTQIGFARLQAILRSRQIVLHYKLFRAIVTQFQAHCRGALVRNAVRHKIERGERCPAMMVPENDVIFNRGASPTSITNVIDGCEIGVVERLFGHLPSGITPHPDLIQNCYSKKQHKTEHNCFGTFYEDGRKLTAVEDNDLKAFQFGKFAAAYFPMQIDSNFTRKPLRVALLNHESDLDKKASIVSDLVSNSAVYGRCTRTTKSFSRRFRCRKEGKIMQMSKLGPKQSLARKFEVQNKIRTEENFLYRNFFKLINSKNQSTAMQLSLVPYNPKQNETSSADDITYDTRNTQEENFFESEGYEQQYKIMLEKDLESNLEKLHFIVGHGILRPDLRQRNPSRSSCARGWILLSLCTGCFAPTNRFLPYLQCFIRENCLRGATHFAVFIEDKLKRTLANGTRDYPPNQIEIQIKDLAMLAAQQYYIDHGDTGMDIEKLENSLMIYLPEDEIQKFDENSNERWLQLILHALRKKFYTNHPSPEQVKEDVVNFAKQKWPLLFSKYFESFSSSNPSLPDGQVLLAVNWQGVSVIDGEDDVILLLPFIKISRIILFSNNANGVQALTIETIDGEEYYLQSAKAKDIQNIVEYFLDGLKKRSKYLMALQDYPSDNSGNIYLFFDTSISHNNDESNVCLKIKKWDLLFLTDEYCGASFDKYQFLRGENTRTGVQGMIPVNIVHILPTISKPSVETLDLFARSQEFECPMNRQISLLANPLIINPEHTLERFASNNFREPTRPPQGLGESFHEQFFKNNLWSYNREPLKMPLLKVCFGFIFICKNKITHFSKTHNYLLTV